MEIFNGLTDKWSEKASSEYIELNNYGYYKDINIEIKVLREIGRADYQIIYVKSGTLLYMDNNAIIPLHDGALLLYRPKERQHYAFLPDAKNEYIWFHFSGCGAAALTDAVFKGKSVISADNPYSVPHAVAALKSFCIKRDSAARSFAAGVILIMLAELQREYSPLDRRVEEVISLMREEGFTETSNKSYASMCGMSESHFIRQFKRLTALTPKQYKIKMLMGQAAELLLSTDMNISETAEYLGFADSLYFSRLFKKEYGTSPRAFKLKSRAR